MSALIFSCSAVNDDALFIDEVKNKDWVLKVTWGHMCSNIYSAQLYSSIFYTKLLITVTRYSCIQTLNTQ